MSLRMLWRGLLVLLLDALTLLGLSLARRCAAAGRSAATTPGAWAAGVFAVLIALGDQGPEVALALALVVLLANGVLQHLVQPIAYGAALKLHPPAVPIVTIAGGCLFGTIGLMLAAPLLSAAVRISADLKAAEREAEAGAACERS